MTGIDSYSITPATNATFDGGSGNWAEGQPPSSVNNTARQMLTDTRNAFNDLAWFQYGTGDQGAGNIAVPAIYASGTSFTIAGVDVTAAYHVGRRVRAVGVSTGTIYGGISASSFSTNTTVTVVWDSGSLSNETLVISLSQIPTVGSPVALSSVAWTPTDVSGAGLSLNVSRSSALKVGGGLWCDLTLSYPVTGNISAAQISLPVTPPNLAGIGGAFAVLATAATFPVYGELTPGNAYFGMVNAAGASVSNLTLSNTQLRTQFFLPTL